MVAAIHRITDMWHDLAGIVLYQEIMDRNCHQRWHLRVASGATAPGPALEGALRFRPKVALLSLSSYILW